MNVEAKHFFIEMSNEELWDTAFDVRYHLESTLKTHWINHQRDWKVFETSRLERLKKMCYALGHPELYEEIFNIQVKIFKDFNDKLEGEKGSKIK